MDFHIARQGEKLEDIAKKHYGTSVVLQELAEVNGIKDPDHLTPGQQIRLPSTLYHLNQVYESAASPDEIAIDMRMSRKICDCDPPTENFPYDEETYALITSLKDLILKASQDHGVPAVAVAGSIADEFNTRRGFKKGIDWFQDHVYVPHLAGNYNYKFKADHFFDSESKFMNATKHDLGIGNIKVETAKEIYEMYKDDFAKKNWDYTDLVDYLMTNGGTVHIAALVIKQAQDLLGKEIADFPMCRNEAVLVTYYKQGKKKYVDEKWKQRKAQNPKAKIRPGEGCRVCRQRDRILEALAQPHDKMGLKVVVLEPRAGASLRVGVLSPIRIQVYNPAPVDYVWLDPQPYWYGGDPDQYLAEGVIGIPRNSYSVDKKAIVLEWRREEHEARSFTGGLRLQEMPPGKVAKFYLRVPKPGLRWTTGKPPDAMASYLLKFPVVA